MKNSNALRAISCLGLGITLSLCLSPRSNAQQTVPARENQPRENQAVAEMYPVVPSRIVERVDDTRLVTLHGNTHPMANTKYDQGLVEPQLPMERIVLLLKRSPEQEAALTAFMEQQYDSKSSNFHHWLQPEEFGRLYGPSDSDISAVTSWLQNHGFQIYQVNKGRVTLEFSGTAAQVQEAFHIEMHHYLVNGKMRLANDRDPQIPEALAPVIGGIASLHNFFPTHQSVLGKYVRRDPKTGKITPVDQGPNGIELDGSKYGGIKPEYGFTNQDGNPQEDITPYDFATIYNLLPLWSAGITGKGQTIAISAVTDINASDVKTFRTTFGLGGFTGAINQIHNGTDPGIVQGALVENTLDTEWSGATAPDANIDVVISASTATSFGGQLSNQYIVEHPSMFTIMSASYGGCEIEIGTAGNATINAIYQQGSAAGISMFESSGDQGSAGCDNSDAQTFPNPAQYGLNVNGDASSPWITAVGGTEFTWVDYRTSYWSATNAANGSNALGYIPEAPWNGTCTNQMLLDRYWNYFYNYTTLEQVCNEAPSSAIDAPAFVKITGGSGGVSSCISSNGSTFASCGGGYPQPSYQKGVTGMPGSTYRYLPDVSLFASSGFPYGLNGSAYLICVASNGGGACDYTNPQEVIYQEVGGTSVSSPALAGIMALVQQKQGKAQGLANPVFYALFKNENLANCNSSTVKNGNSCIFYDTTYSNNSQVCSTGSRNCVTDTAGDTYGIVSGYATTTGYDQATGLGSVNATNLVNSWASAVGTSAPAITLTPTTLSFASTTVGATSAAQVVTVKNTGTAAATLTSETVTGTSFLKSATTCGTTLAAAASCTVSVEFKPTAAGALTGSLTIADNATGSPQTVTLSGTGAAAVTHTLSLSPTSLAFGSEPVGSTTAAQVVTVKNTGTGALTLSSETVSAPFVKSATTCGTSLAVGASCTVSVEFKPTAAVASTGTLVVASNGTSSPASVALTGTGTAVATPTLSLTPTSIAFPNTIVGATSDAVTVAVKNTGTVSVTLSSITLGGTNGTSFELLDTCGATLAASASCNLYIAFKPASAAALTGTVSIADNATGSPQKVTLTGTGTAAPSVKLSVTSLAFPTTTHGTTSDALPVTLTNSGTAILTVTSITLTGTNPTDFEALDTCGATLAPAASCTVYVGFSPAAAAAYSAKLSIADNGAGSPQSVTLTGTGK